MTPLAFVFSWKFREMINFRETTVSRLGLELITYTNEDGLRQGITPFNRGSRHEVASADSHLKAVTAA